MSHKFVFVFLALAACSTPSSVGVWSGATSGCDDPALDEEAVTVSIANAPDGEAALDVLSTVAFPGVDAAACTGESTAVDPDAAAFDVAYPLSCDAGEVEYLLSVTIDADDVMAGFLSWDGGACEVTLTR